MSKIMVLGATGSGKSTALGKIPELNIEGLDPKITFIIACTDKGLPFGGWKKMYTKVLVKKDNAGLVIDIKPTGNYYQTNNGSTIASLIRMINKKRDDIINIVIDDSNYIMQDYYMINALKSGYDVFKKIGKWMGDLFSAINSVDSMNKNVIMMGHHEEFRDSSTDTLSFRYKTVGKMVQDYSTPEGKFEIVLFCGQEYDDQEKKINKFFVTNYDGKFPAKTPVGMFDDLHVPNDLGAVLKAVKQYEEGVNQ